MAHSPHSLAIGPRGAAGRAFAFSRTPAAAFGLGLLLVHLVLSPLLFCTGTLGAFEYPKAVLLTLTAVLLGALGLHVLLRPPGRARLAAPHSRAGGLPWWRQPLLLGFVLFLVSAAASTAASISPVTSLLGAHESHAGLGTVAACVGLFFAARGFCRNATDARLLLAGGVVAAAVASAYALLQFAG